MRQVLHPRLRGGPRHGPLRQLCKGADPLTYSRTYLLTLTALFTYVSTYELNDATPNCPAHLAYKAIPAGLPLTSRLE